LRVRGVCECVRVRVSVCVPAAPLLGAPFQPRRLKHRDQRRVERGAATRAVAAPGRRPLKPLLEQTEGATKSRTHGAGQTVRTQSWNLLVEKQVDAGADKRRARNSPREATRAEAAANTRTFGSPPEKNRARSSSSGRLGAPTASASRLTLPRGAGADELRGRPRRLLPRRRLRLLIRRNEPPSSTPLLPPPPLPFPSRPASAAMLDFQVTKDDTVAMIGPMFRLLPARVPVRVETCRALWCSPEWRLVWSA